MPDPVAVDRKLDHSGASSLIPGAESTTAQVDIMKSEQKNLYSVIPQVMKKGDGQDIYSSQFGYQLPDQKKKDENLAENSYENQDDDNEESATVQEVKKNENPKKKSKQIDYKF